ncbi:Zn-dependent protease with chaperone function [Stackebrandtia albiflava]|uniref:Zn-dependent protease with chaperone function n=1 Tax=Stackebrandtia albiflava TaxID=406432 RepID=A0A562VBC6_9ACTN|nr:M56 family metallopeptidase [Stackebrandtia albiflava]TWJ15183.1 Zn-dependent protease with chaperone function [Stackebrandtia albiflava]
MHLHTLTILLVTSAVAFALLGPVPAMLERARWPSREPRAALILWQAIGLAGGVAVLAAAMSLALAPLHPSPLIAAGAFAGNLFAGDPTGGLGVAHFVLFLFALAMSARLAGVLPMTIWRTWQARHRHRDLVGLVSRPWPASRPGHGHVLDHPVAAVYCLPGRAVRGAPRVVFTTGALAQLDDTELSAVLAHEHAHLTERHDLVAMPFLAWVTAFPWFPGVRRARVSVAMLLELVADDRAATTADPAALASALARIGGSAGAATPDGALAITGAGVLLRVRRLLDPPPRSPRWRATAYLMAATLVMLPPSVMLPVW